MTSNSKKQPKLSGIQSYAILRKLKVREVRGLSRFCLGLIFVDLAKNLTFKKSLNNERMGWTSPFFLQSGCITNSRSVLHMHVFDEICTVVPFGVVGLWVLTGGLLFWLVVGWLVCRQMSRLLVCFALVAAVAALPGMYCIRVWTVHFSCFDLAIR